MIDLALCMTVKSAELKAHKRHALEVCGVKRQALLPPPNPRDPRPRLPGARPRGLCRPRGAVMRASAPHREHPRSLVTPERAGGELRRGSGVGRLTGCLSAANLHGAAPAPSTGLDAGDASTPETTFLMFADSEMEKDDWIGAIGRAIVRCSSTYTNDDGDDGEGSDSD